VIGLVWNAIRSRRAQAASIWALTLLAVGAAAATPWYALATREALARRAVAAAPAAERFVIANTRPQSPGQPADPKQLAESVRHAIGPLAAAPEMTSETISEYSLSGRVVVSQTPFSLAVNSRDRLCRHALVDGSCPTAAGQIVVGQVTADQLGLNVGDTIAYTPDETKQPITLTVVGRYQPMDPLELYWYGILKGPQDLEPAFTVPQTITAVAARATTTVSLRLEAPAYEPDLSHRLDVATQGLRAEGIGLRTSAGDLAARIAAERLSLLNGIVVAAARLVLLCGVALFVAVRHAAQAHRTDVGLVRLRGVRSWRVWTSSLAPTAAPMIAAAVLGAPLGVLGARLLAGPVRAVEARNVALLGCLAAAGAVVACALAVAAFAQAQAARATVGELLRDVPARSRAGRALDVVELVVLLLAAVGVWQLISVEEVRTGTIAPAAAPALLALAAGLLVSRLLLRIAELTGGWALRAGRLPTSFAALSASRRPALRWVVTLLVVAVAGLAGAVADAERARPAIADRAAQELGAARVLTVSAASRLVVRDAVREVDLQGRYAMAVAEYARPAGVSDGVLAVDTPRLARMALWRPEYGPRPEVAPAVASLPAVTDGLVTLAVTEAPQRHLIGREDGQTYEPQDWPAVAPDVHVVATLVSRDGVETRAVWGPLAPGRHEYTATVDRCPSGCRLVSLSLITRPPQASGSAAGRDGLPQWGTQVQLHSLSRPDAVVIGPGEFADRLRWRGAIQPDALPAQLSADPQGLTLTVPPTCGIPLRGTCLPSAYPLAAPVPLPVVVAGSPGYGNRIRQTWLDLLGAPALPVQVIRQVGALPRLGSSGVLADLSELDNLVGVRLSGEQLQVWLTADAPDSLVDALAQRGVRTLRQDTLSTAAAALDGDAPAAVRRFALLAAVLGLLIAATALLLAAASGRVGAVRDLAALRLQGLREPVVRRTGLAFYGWPPLAAIAAGLAAAAAAAALPIPPAQIFSDRWHVLAPPPGGVPLIVLAGAGLAGGLVAAAAVGWASGRLTAAVRGRTGAAPVRRRAKPGEAR
jgi:putative ABC transport system permease protein